MKSLRFVLQIAVIFCVGAGLRADESQYLLTPQSSIDQIDTQLQSDSPERQRDLVPLPIGPRDSQKHPLRTVISSLAIVLGAFLLATAILRKQSKSQTPTSASSGSALNLMDNMGELQLTPEVKLNLVRIGSRLLVLHLSDDGVQTVAEITDSAEVQQLLHRSKATVEAEHPASQSSTEFHQPFESFDNFDSHPQVSDLLRRVEGQVKELA